MSGGPESLSFGGRPGGGEVSGTPRPAVLLPSTQPPRSPSRGSCSREGAQDPRRGGDALVCAHASVLGQWGANTGKQPPRPPSSACRALVCVLPEGRAPHLRLGPEPRPLHSRPVARVFLESSAVLGPEVTRLPGFWVTSETLTADRRLLTADR